MAPGGFEDAQFAVRDMLDFELVVLGAKIEVVVADDDDGAGTYRVQRRLEIALV